ncbi:hypothetical protein [Streptomyces sp. C10-9-1]
MFRTKKRTIVAALAAALALPASAAVAVAGEISGSRANGYVSAQN